MNINCISITVKMKKRHTERRQKGEGERNRQRETGANLRHFAQWWLLQRWSIIHFSFLLPIIVFSRHSFSSLLSQTLIRGNVHIRFGFLATAPFTSQCFLNTFIDFQICVLNPFSNLRCHHSLSSLLNLLSILSEKQDEEILICSHCLRLLHLIKTVRQLFKDPLKFLFLMFIKYHSDFFQHNILSMKACFILEF